MKKDNQFQKEHEYVFKEGNEYAFKPGESGSIKKYQNPADLQTAIDAYFKKQDKLKKPYTITGLALGLGFTSRMALLNYEEKEGYEEFHHIVKVAKSKIEEQVEELLLTSGSVAGKIFNLKNNFKNWKDSTEISHKLPEKEVKGFNYLPPTDGAND